MSARADITWEPARPTALATSGQASSLRSSRTLARRRPLAHQGIAVTRVRMPPRTGIGAVAGPMKIAAVSHPPAFMLTMAAYARSAGRSRSAHAFRAQSGGGTVRAVTVVMVARANHGHDRGLA